MDRLRLILIAVFFALSLLIGSKALAHEPRYVKDDQLVIIKNPGISQAFYGELRGWPALYLINLKEAQELYFQLLAPDLPEIQRDKTVAVEYSPELGVKAESFLYLDSASTTWQSFYEEYAGDNYFEGPSVKRPGETGYYIIKITSPDNLGKYVLVVGEKEEFPPLEIAKALITIPQLKTKFFNKPPWRSFEGKIGKYFGLGLLIVIIAGYMFHKFRRIYK